MRGRGLFHPLCEDREAAVVGGTAAVVGPDQMPALPQPRGREYRLASPQLGGCENRK